MNTFELDSDLGHQLIAEPIEHVEITVSDEHALLAIRTNKRDIRVRLDLGLHLQASYHNVHHMLPVIELLPATVRPENPAHLAHPPRQ